MSHQPYVKLIRRFVEETERKPSLSMDAVLDWLSCENLGAFIEDTSRDWILVHISTKDYFLNSFMIDHEFIDHYRTKNVLDLNFPLAEIPQKSWTI
jgi:hypothetical protein